MSTREFYIHTAAAPDLCASQQDIVLPRKTSLLSTSSTAAAGVRRLGQWNRNIKSSGKFTNFSTQIYQMLEGIQPANPALSKWACLT